MSILRVKCSKCTRVLKVPGKYAGRVISCPGCKQKLRVPEPVMDAQIVDDDEFDDAPAPRPRTQAKRRSKAATAPKDDKMTASDWVAGVLLFAIGPVLVALYAMRGNPKWKPLLAVSAGMYLLVACVAYWQSDTLVDYLAWQGKEEQRINKDGPRSSFSDGLAYDPAQDDFSEEDQQVADAIREELERRQESAEAMAAPPSAADLNQMDAVRQRAFRANVRIDVEGFGLGSGIVCQIDNGAAGQSRVGRQRRS